MFKTSMFIFTMISGAVINIGFAQEYMPSQEQEVSNSADLNTQKHDNTFIIWLGPNIFRIEYENLTADVTPGQPYDKPSSQMFEDPNKARLEVYLSAGRHGDFSVANRFKSRLGNNFSHMYGLKAVDDPMPTLLNFYISGNLSINGEPIGKDAFLLGQGHTSGWNNWWLGSNSAPDRPHKLSSLEVVGNSGRHYCFYQKDGLSNEVTVKEGSC